MRRLLPIALAVALLTVACSADDSGAVDTSTDAAAATVSTDFPDFPIPVVDGYTTVVTNEETLVELEYPFSDAESIVAFYEEWTVSEGGWSSNDPNPEIGVWGTFQADNGDTIEVLGDSPDFPAVVFLNAGGS